MSSPASNATPSPARIFATLRAFQETGALKTAIELGVFTAIAEGAVTAGDIAAKTEASGKGIRILCDTLTVSGLLTKTDGAYANTPDTALFLNRHSPAYMGSVADFLCSHDMLADFMDTLSDAVRKGGTVRPDRGTVSDNNPIWVTFARSMAPVMMPAAHAIARYLPSSGPLKVLDIAAGHGMFGVTVASRNPEAQIVALDWAAVLEVAKENAAKAGIASRYSTLEGSAFDLDFGTGYDAILITNFLHHFDPETNERVLRKVHAALRPGGVAVTLEFVPGEDRISPPVSAHFAITMLFTTAHGDAYTFAEYETMFSAAGFASNVQHVLDTQQSVIISTK